MLVIQKYIVSAFTSILYYKKEKIYKTQYIPNKNVFVGGMTQEKHYRK